MASGIQEHKILSKVTCITSMIFFILSCFWTIYLGSATGHLWGLFWVVNVYIVIFALLTTFCMFPEEWINIRHTFINLHLTAYKTYFGRCLLYNIMIPLIISANIHYGWYSGGPTAFHVISIINIIFACFYIFFAICEFVLGIGKGQ